MKEEHRRIAFSHLETLCCGSLWLWLCCRVVVDDSLVFQNENSRRLFVGKVTENSKSINTFPPIKIHLNQFTFHFRFVSRMSLKGGKERDLLSFFWIHGNTLHANEIQLYLTLSFIFCLSCII